MSSSENRIPLSIFSKHRKALIGLATVCILFIHSPLPFAQFNILRTIWDLLFGVVDVFFFLSGMGLYYSLDNGKNILTFYTHRFLKIVPELFLVSILWLMISTPSITVESFCKQVLLLQFWTKSGRTYWFFNLLLILYLCYPFIHFVYKKYSLVGFLILFVSTISFTVLANYYLPSYSSYEIALTRIPAFLLGAWVGKLIKEKHTISHKCIWISCATIAVLGIICYLGYIGIITTLPYRYCSAAFCLCLFFLIATLFSKFQLKNLKTFFIWLSRYSMECYLIYEKVMGVIAPHFLTYPMHGIIQSIIGVVITLVLAICLNRICHIVISEFTESKKQVNSI